MEKIKKQKICVHCQKVFTCGYANTDKNECENYISSRMSKEEFERKLWLKKTSGGDVRRMIEDIVKAYNEYQSKVKNAPQDFIDCVLVLNPANYSILIQECRDKMFFNLYTDIEWIEILGEDVPVIIDEQLPKNVKFLIKSRAEYERLEQEKLYKKIEEMFRRTEDGFR